MPIRITHRWKVRSSSGNKEYWKVGVRLPDNSYQEMLYSRLIVERILGKTLPRKAVVHHVNEDSLYDWPGNLVACEDDAYHKLLHLRTNALKATGNPNARRCVICKQWGVPGDGDMVLYKRSARPKGAGTPKHRSCHRNQERMRLRRKAKCLTI